MIFFVLKFCCETSGIDAPKFSSTSFILQGQRATLSLRSQIPFLSRCLRPRRQGAKWRVTLLRKDLSPSFTPDFLALPPLSLSPSLSAEKACITSPSFEEIFHQSPTLPLVIDSPLPALSRISLSRLIINHEALSSSISRSIWGQSSDSLLQASLIGERALKMERAALECFLR